MHFWKRKGGKEVEIQDSLFPHESKASALVFPCHLAIRKLLLGCERFHGNEWTLQLHWQHCSPSPLTPFSFSETLFFHTSGTNMEMKTEQAGQILHQAKTYKGLRTSVWLQVTSLRWDRGFSHSLRLLSFISDCRHGAEYCIRLGKWPESWKAAACSEEDEF